MQQVDPAVESIADLPTTDTPPKEETGGILRRLGLYIAMVVWAVAGLAYTDLYPLHSRGFWEITTVIFAVIAIVRVFMRGGPDRYALALKQLGHWGAFLIAMVLLHSHFVNDLVTGDALGLVVLLMLAVAIFTDGLYVDWRFCLVGAVLAAGVVMLAILNDAAVGIFVVGAVGLAALFVFRRFHFRRRSAAEA
jgi:hypothetical protein